MPKLHDLCQLFWEEVSQFVPQGEEPHGEEALAYEKIVERAYITLKKYRQEDADQIKGHLLLLADEMHSGEMYNNEIHRSELRATKAAYNAVDQLTRDIFK